ncbi:phosphoglycolate phosphatase [Oleiagrimonas sp.]|jgi:2-phosphoglycolate phosphatase|uniref:phosphoglycolate phosphatase n=1 Tax=Oleiagrimonas sp. TaxID=2010330 RepID=UPI0026204EAB|nr:phosphoglycolate phosphatase [Oleiagrimonas sp.]MDA3912658.1 phosphoglycolate phosphatase [Oleiagrimonas sp.]
MKRPATDLSGVLFDLDGTLLDSAPDLYAALVELSTQEGVTPPDYALVREVVSRGARAVLRRGLEGAGDDRIETLLPRFLELYARIMGRDSHPFAGVETLLDTLESAKVPWGIVTNKAGFLAEPLLQRLALYARAAVVVCGDTLAQRKPDPMPVLHACERAGMDPQRAVFVGDDMRDVQAGRSAGLFSVAVSWGYLDGGDPHAWEADAVVDSPRELITLLGLEARA